MGIRRLFLGKRTARAKMKIYVMLQKAQGPQRNVVRKVADSWTSLMSLVSFLVSNRILGR